MTDYQSFKSQTKEENSMDNLKNDPMVNNILSGIDDSSNQIKDSNLRTTSPNLLAIPLSPTRNNINNNLSGDANDQQHPNAGGGLNNNTFELIDSDPRSSDMNVIFINDTLQCFKLDTEKTVPFNSQQLQPFQVGNSIIRTNDDMKNYLNSFQSGSECDQYAFYSLCNTLVSSSKVCHGKPLCYNDCQTLNDKLKSCNFPVQNCSRTEQPCTGLNDTINDNGPFLAWWAILLIILALLSPCFLCFFGVCKKTDKKKTKTLHTIKESSSWGSNSLDRSEVNAMNLADASELGLNHETSNPSSEDFSYTPQSMGQEFAYTPSTPDSYVAQNNLSNIADTPPIENSPASSIISKGLRNEDNSYNTPLAAQSEKLDTSLAIPLVIDKSKEVKKRQVDHKNPNSFLTDEGNSSKNFNTIDSAGPNDFMNFEEKPNASKLESADDLKEEAIPIVSENLNNMNLSSAQSVISSRVVRQKSIKQTKHVEELGSKNKPDESQFHAISYKQSFGESSVVEKDVEENAQAEQFTAESYYETLLLYGTFPADLKNIYLRVSELNKGQYESIYDGTFVSEGTVNICRMSYLFKRLQLIKLELIDLDTKETFSTQCHLSRLITASEIVPWNNEAIEFHVKKEPAELGNIRFGIKVCEVEEHQVVLRCSVDGKDLISVDCKSNAISEGYLQGLVEESVVKFELVRNGTSLGYSNIPIVDLLSGAIKEMTLISSPDSELKISFEYFSEEKRNNLTEFLQCGLNLKFSLGIDFTSSNKTPHNSSSLHFIGPQGREISKLTEYEKAIKLVGDLISSYGANEITAYGFGAEVRSGTKYKINHSFDLSEEKNIVSVETLLKAYRKKLRSIKLSGPTNFAPHLKLASKIARQSRKEYYVHLIITDGQVTDYHETMEELISCSNFPISVIILGVGSENFTKMHSFSGENGLLTSRDGSRKSRRDVCDFYEVSLQKNPENILENIPFQILEYFKMKNLQPKDFK
eukprot:NODE_907_length_3140_cov_0.862874.p1 type:complete len:981 gc:universal NODE_907_length_3140_cov_0.862874:35-2977(+)